MSAIMRANAKRFVDDQTIKVLCENIKIAILSSDLNIEEIPDELEGQIIDTVLDSFGSFIENNNTLYFTLLFTTVLYDMIRKVFEYTGLGNLF